MITEEQVTITTFECTMCKAKQEYRAGFQLAGLSAYANGWRSREDSDYCPQCIYLLNPRACKPCKGTGQRGGYVHERDSNDCEHCHGSGEIES